MSVAAQIAVRHFGRKGVKALERKGITLIGLQSLPDAKGSFLNSETGYCINHNGCGRVLSYNEMRKEIES